MNFYLQEKKNDSRIAQFQIDVNENFENWADFEKQLGVYTEKYEKDKVDDFCFCVKDFKSSLIKHLKNEEKRINYDLHKEEIITICGTALTNFYKDLNQYSQDLFRQMINNAARQQSITYNFITFNYTNIFDNCVDFVKKTPKQQNSIHYNIGKILHIHGDISKNPLIGVDNAGQINNTELANINKIDNLIIKPIINKKLKKFNDRTATELIQNGDIICLFGLSLGETDRTWWQQIGQRLLQPNVQLIIFNIADNWNPIHADEEIENIDNVINKFYEAANIDSKNRTQLNPRIHIGLNTDLFKMNLVNDNSNKSVTV
ncbi:MAG: bacteriophage abortive infection AbiH family protein [Bacteroidales bacterium]|nr:bacteriophage abortive infection AbiH family protein [Bacteroidales bacterium]